MWSLGVIIYMLLCSSTIFDAQEIKKDYIN